MTHEELPMQMLGRVMRIGQLLASVETHVFDLKPGEDEKRELEDEFGDRNEVPKKKPLKQ